MRIAIVEDDPQTNKQLKQYVERYYEANQQSVEVVCFFDGEEITESYKCDFDIILMDIEMKFVDGISAAGRACASRKTNFAQCRRQIPAYQHQGRRGKVQLQRDCLHRKRTTQIDFAYA